MSEYRDEPEEVLKNEFPFSFGLRDSRATPLSPSSSGQSMHSTAETANVIDRDECYYFTDVIFLVSSSHYAVAVKWLILS
jgi:hypothetical protein